MKNNSDGSNETIIKSARKRYNRNQYILYVGCFVIVLIVLALFIRKQMLRLKEPVFLRNCAEVYIMEQYNHESLHQYLTLQYLTNADDQRNIWGVEFDENPALHGLIASDPLSFMNSMMADGMENTLGDYQLHTVTLQFYVDQYAPLKEEIQLPAATIMYNDGSRQKVDLGTIVLVPWERREQIKLFHGMRNWGKKTENSMEYNCSLPDGYTITQLNSVLGDAFQDQVMFNYGDYQNIPWNQTLKDPIPMDSDSAITMEVSFDPSNDTSYDSYCLRPEITTKHDGKEETSLIDTAKFCIPLNTYQQVLNYLRKRGTVHG